jgi:hypothetical protein
MADYSTVSGAPKEAPAPGSDLGTEIIDVLIRGLSNAKEQMERGEATTRGRACIGLYVDSEHWCALFYTNPQKQA